MKKKAFFALIVLFCALSLSFCASAWDGEDPFAVPDVSVRNYDVKVDIDENNIYTVNVSINAYYNKGMYGIDIGIPLTESVNVEFSGEKIKEHRRVRVYGIEADCPVSIKTEKDCKIIKTGSTGGRITGSKTYNISYKYRPAIDSSGKLDYICYSLYPVLRDYPVESSSVTVSLPLSVNVRDIRFFGGSYGENSTASMDYSAKGNTISAALKEKLAQGENVVLCIKLPDGCFSLSAGEIILRIIFVLLTLGAPATPLLLWTKYSKRKRRSIVPVSLPPNGITAAETGYVMNGSVSRRDVIALFLYWASFGIINIREYDDHMKIYGTDVAPEAMRSFERAVFDMLFRNKKELTLKTGTLYKQIGEARHIIESDLKSDPSRRIYTRHSVRASKICALLIPVPSFLCFTLGAYLCSASKAGIMAFVVTALIILAEAVMIMSSRVKRTASSGQSIVYLAAFSAFLVAAAVCSFISISRGINAGLIFLMFAATAAGFLLLPKMHRRSRRSELALLKLSGLKKFIIEARPDEIEKLNSEDPQYFYSVLPFAYAMGLSDKWAKKFERLRLSPPLWYAFEDGETPKPFNSIVFLRTLKKICGILTHKFDEQKDAENQ